MSTESDQSEREGRIRVAPKPTMAIPKPYFEYPLPIEETTDFVTPSEKLFVLAHLGIPQIDVDGWRVDITGLVRTPESFSYDDLMGLTPTSVRAVHQCAGNPLDSTTPTRTIANVEWRGVLLREVLDRVGVLESCKYVWAFGQDYGAFDVASHSSPYQEHYVKDLPIDYVMREDVIIATHLNGEPLSIKHGFPARIVAPGFYANNSVKWLCRLEAADRRANGYFTNELYNDPSSDGSAPKPVWEIAPESLIVYPANDSLLRDVSVAIWGWAWSGSTISSVEVSTDGGQSWNSAVVDSKTNGSWQRFRHEWTPNKSGRYEVVSRATDSTGRKQPMAGARNAVHRVAVTVR